MATYFGDIQWITLKRRTSAHWLRLLSCRCRYLISRLHVSISSYNTSDNTTATSGISAHFRTKTYKTKFRSYAAEWRQYVPDTDSYTNSAWQCLFVYSLGPHHAMYLSNLRRIILNCFTSGHRWNETISYYADLRGGGGVTKTDELILHVMKFYQPGTNG